MSAENETIADIEAEMRYGTIPKHRTDHELLALYADRIEAALKRECGNAAALREAVVLALSLLDLKEGVPYKTVSQKDIDFMKAALSALPRNCDVGTPEERLHRYHELCREISDRHERIGEHAPSFAFPTAFEWEDRPYEKGGAE